MIDLTAELKRFDEPRLKLLLDFFAAHFLRFLWDGQIVTIMILWTK